MYCYSPIVTFTLKQVALQIENRGNRNNYLNVANEWMITHAIHELIIVLVREAHNIRDNPD